jgi:guanine nucleotide-binding protein subunit beta-2-like 1 protein
MSESTLEYRGFMKGHQGWVNTIQVGTTKDAEGKESEFLVSGGRDGNLITWEITEKKIGEDNEWGIPKKVLSSHSHFVQDLALSLDSRYALSASWDKTLRLWDLTSGNSTTTFVGHEKDVLTCSFSADNRQIASGARDGEIKIWNTVGECKFTVEDEKHSDWVSAIRFSPDTKSNTLATGSWDGSIKVWDSQSMTLQNTFLGHSNAVTTLAYATKSCYLASGGKDGNIILWNIEAGKHLKHLTTPSSINQVLFSTTKYWIVAATNEGIVLWDLVNDKTIANISVHLGDDEESDSDDDESKEEKKVVEKKKVPALSVAWSKNGNFLYTGWADNTIRVYEVVES